MKKYLFFRIIRSIVSIFLVTTLTYGIIYSLVPRRAIFKDDPNLSKLKSNPDKYLDYQNTAYSKMDYIDYYDSKQLLQVVKKEYPEVTAENTSENTKIYDEWAKKNNWKIGQFEVGKGYYATKEVSLLQRVGRFYKNLIQIDHPWKIKDPENPNLKRYLKIEHDPEVGWALVGSGTQYRYQVYFNGKFPFIHQNFLHFNLGTSYPTFAGLPVTQVIGGGQGKLVSQEITLPDGQTKRSAANMGSRQYTMTDQLTASAKKQFGDNYTTTTSVHQDPSMVGISFRMGIVAVFISYLVAIPMSILMARFKGKLVDKAGIALVTVLISVPSLAFIYFFRFVGNKLFDLPEMFPTLGAGNVKSYILPTVILGLLSVPGLVIWVRRYMIDQQSADYVKFAKAKGLSAGEISRRHIFKNAVIPITNGIPGSIIGTIAGATITETIFAAPGMGKMLPDAIKAHNNPIVIGLVLIFTTLSVTSVFLGDLTMALVDPRIKLNSSKGDD